MFVDGLDRPLEAGKLHHRVRDLATPERSQGLVEPVDAFLGPDFGGGGPQGGGEGPDVAGKVNRLKVAMMKVLSYRCVINTRMNFE